MIDRSITKLDVLAKSNGITIFDLMDYQGNSAVAPMVAARAQLLNALAYLQPTSLVFDGLRWRTEARSRIGES